jgi:acyl-CoA synthetase (NDP forming)
MPLAIPEHKENINRKSAAWLTPPAAGAAALAEDPLTRGNKPGGSATAVAPARDLARLLRPRSVALYGGAWAENVIAELQRARFPGPIWPIHPTRAEIRGVGCHRALPAAPDAAFVGVNRARTVEIVHDLAAAGAGGAVCFASGFREAGDAGLEAALVEAAGAMPILGPNCYGFINYLDGVPLWPDQHGGVRVARGVAIVTQSSNLAINLSMQRRALPVAYLLTAGNQAQTSLAALGLAALDDPRVTALGLHVEGFGDLPAFEALAARARALEKPVVVLKAGHSAAARAAALSHTASLAGGAAVASAFLARLGLVEVASPAVLLETLKLLHLGGPLAGPAIASVSCSGGEASLIADLAATTAARFRPFTPPTADRLAAALGARVAVANPLDYHTFVWGDAAATTEVFSAVLADRPDLTVFVLDLPRRDRCDPAAWEPALAAIEGARAATGARAAVLASLPENLDEAAAARLAARGIATLHGMADGLAAIDAAVRAGRPAPPAPPAVLAPEPAGPALLTEAEAKAALAAAGLPVPRSAVASDPDALAAAAASLRFPVALKALGVAHKTEAGAVALNLPDAAALRAAAAAMPAPAGYLAEEMVPDPVAELIVGVTRDPSGLMALTIGAGGLLAELLQDSATLILPTTPDAIRAALASLRLAPILAGYRGRPAADLAALTAAIAAVAAFAEAHAGRLAELEVNPLVATPTGAFAADALLRLAPRTRR